MKYIVAPEPVILVNLATEEFLEEPRRGAGAPCPACGQSNAMVPLPPIGLAQLFSRWLIGTDVFRGNVEQAALSFRIFQALRKASTGDVIELERDDHKALVKAQEALQLPGMILMQLLPLLQAIAEAEDERPVRTNGAEAKASES